MVHSVMITAEQKAAFDADGAVVLRGVLDDRWIARGRDGIERCLQATSESNDPDAYFKQLRVWEQDDDLAALCRETALPMIASALLGSDKVNLLYDQVFVKEAGEHAPTPWHNDQPYWPVSGTQILTVWLAFDHVTAENGALEFVRGSHRDRARYRTFHTDADGGVSQLYDAEDADDYEPLPDFDAMRSDLDLIGWEMESGDAIAFHAFTVHHAPGNSRLDRRRRAYAVRMTGDDVRYQDADVWNRFIKNPDLKTGDALDSAQYPVLLGGVP